MTNSNGGTNRPGGPLLLDDPAWHRVLPPMSELPMIERERMVADFFAWDARLPPAWRSLTPASETSRKIVGLLRA